MSRRARRAERIAFAVVPGTLKVAGDIVLRRPILAPRQPQPLPVELLCLFAQIRTPEFLLDLPVQPLLVFPHLGLAATG